MASPGKKAFPLRIDPALWAELQRLAANDLRSVNAEIEFLLREALARRGIKVQPPARGADDAGDGGDPP
ncbi:hypothetical protein [Pseudoduganella albidiflava]|uniref:Toxin-antitoxin system HicB family antitoxin n=1 Tax=Pseudoduganella albidiflava TaxID=321983 RepID=A0A411WY32_9BURK|nr:hypothetical protein [Pseudoduganella albidiflava]QBI01602.1 hypothetical protein EYF70_12660 [Pseudoduganella albidiflava]GGY34360.1 hypothetical protein GCM10007387_15370 [Pseudoduganella albidiflava]